MFELFTNEKIRRKKNHLINLIALSKADGNIDINEKMLLYKVGERNGFTASQVEDLIGKSLKATITRPESNEERFSQVFDVVELMLADGQVDEDELDFAIDYASKLGFKKEIVGVLVRKISMGLTEGASKEGLKNELTPFLNY
ncbi:MAG: TerB family tellurite resistance protein [Cytophagales bacterium]|nr:TerB family tellurite resistance protein [Cytophagales bacterium]